jgi:hypothetical protein
MSDPDFYLASQDSYNVEQPRRVWRIKRMSTPYRDDLLLVRVDPPIAVEGFGSSARFVDLVLLAVRHKGASLFPIAEWPVSVHVARPLVDNVEGRDKLLAHELENNAWAEVYRNEEEAARRKR